MVREKVLWALGYEPPSFSLGFTIDGPLNSLFRFRDVPVCMSWLTTYINIHIHHI